MHTIVAPSLLAADPSRYGEEIASVVQAGAEWLHLDIMDGSFVPPISFGDSVVRMARARCSLFLDVHLMVQHPETHLETMKNAGAGCVTVHQEVSPHLHRTLSAIRHLGMKAGVALNPSTPGELILPVLDICDLVLVMSVNPGWGGQPFIEAVVPKIEFLHSEIAKHKLSTVIEVDGGITTQTAALCKKAGASVMVAGSSVFGVTDRAQAIASLRDA